MRCLLVKPSPAAPSSEIPRRIQVDSRQIANVQCTSVIERRKRPSQDLLASQCLQVEIASTQARSCFRCSGNGCSAPFAASLLYQAFPDPPQTLLSFVLLPELRNRSSLTRQLGCCRMTTQTVLLHQGRIVRSYCPATTLNERARRPPHECAQTNRSHNATAFPKSKPPGATQNCLLPLRDRILST